MNDDHLGGRDLTEDRSTRDESKPSARLDETELDTDADAAYRLADEPASAAVIEAVATALDADPLSLEPLYYSIDTDALDELFASDRLDADVTVRFTYADCRVTVDGAGAIFVDALED